MRLENVMISIHDALVMEIALKNYSLRSPRSLRSLYMDCTNAQASRVLIISRRCTEIFG
jgi:hypothetical protein